jgi:hypothetical protein
MSERKATKVLRLPAARATPSLLSAPASAQLIAPPALIHCGRSAPIDGPAGQPCIQIVLEI